MTDAYIHGSSDDEQRRLALMNSLINPVCLEALAPGSEQRVLDVGAGTGQFTREIAARLDASAVVVAVERDPRQRAAAEAAGPSANGASIEWRAGSAEDPPLTDDERGRFQLAHARYLLEHVPRPQRVVDAMVATLAPGGRVVLADDDHALLRTWPEPVGFSEAWRAYYRSYRGLGTDPLVGRKLAAMIHAAGARPVRVTQLFYGACAGEPAFDGLVRNLLGVLAGAREAVLSDGQIEASAYDRAMAGLDAFRARPDAALWYVINWAEGRRRSP